MTANTKYLLTETEYVEAEELSDVNTGPKKYKKLKDYVVVCDKEILKNGE